MEQPTFIAALHTHTAAQQLIVPLFAFFASRARGYRAAARWLSRRII
jgi:hypothetical protein